MAIRRASRRSAFRSLRTALHDFPGPLAGILAALDWAAANRPDVKLVLSAAADCPFLPRDLVSRLYGALGQKMPSWPSRPSDGQSHPVVGLWSVALARAAAARTCRRRRQEDRPLDRALRLATVTWPTDAARSILQRQHHGRYRRSRSAGLAGRGLIRAPDAAQHEVKRCCPGPIWRPRDRRQRTGRTLRRIVTRCTASAYRVYAASGTVQAS